MSLQQLSVNCNWIYIVYLSSLFTIVMFTHSMTTLDKTKYIRMHKPILDTLKIMCTKNLCHIFMLTYFTSLSFQSFDAVIIFWRFCSGHVTLHWSCDTLLWSCDTLLWSCDTLLWSCDTAHISLRWLILSIFAGIALKHQSVFINEMWD